MEGYPRNGEFMRYTPDKYWNYRVVKYAEQGEGYGLHEVHYKGEKVVNMTERPIVVGSSPESIYEQLLTMRVDAKKRPILDEPTFTNVEFNDPTFRPLLTSAVHALRSYEFGNASPDLAKEVADTLDKILANLHPELDDEATRSQPSTPIRGGIKLPVHYDEGLMEIFDAGNVSIAFFTEYESRERARNQAEQIVAALNSQSRVRELVSALELYADEANWSAVPNNAFDQMMHDYFTADFVNGGYDIAQAALEAVKEIELK
jgi:hypothetical protein